MVRCAIEGCTNYQGKKDVNARFFCFPKEENLKEEWLQACGKGKADLNVTIARVCSRHFADDAWKLQDILLNVPEHKRKLKMGAVPTINMLQSGPSKREERMRRREQKELVEQAISNYERKYAMNIATQFEEPIEVEQRVCRKSGLGVFIEPDDPLRTQPGPETELLLKEVTFLKRHVRRLTSRLHQAETAISSMEQFFTEGQVKRVKNPNKKYKWSYEDITSAASLYYAGPAGYSRLLKLYYPLPPPAKLKKWAAILKLSPGILDSTVKLLSGLQYESNDRLCILSFHEISLGANQTEEIPESGYNHKDAQAFVVRGLISDWQQIIYYNYDCTTTSAVKVLKEIIRTLKDINYTVVAVVSGVGLRKLHLWPELRVDRDHPFVEFIKGEKVFFFGNISHLIKNFRNCFICEGFTVNDKHVNADPLREFLCPAMPDLELSFKFTEAHTSTRKVTRQNVQLAWQLLTQPVANALRKCVSMGKIYSPNAIECSDLIQLFSDWLDVFNAKYTNEGCTEGSLAYGLALEEQNEAIMLMNQFLMSITRRGQKTALPFQRGILLNNASLVQMREYLLQTYGINYVITNRLNQDDLEQVLKIRRANTGVGGRPTALEFKYRIYSGVLSNSCQ